MTGLFSFWDVQIFFFLSGVFLSSKNTLENSLYKKTKSLIFPFLFFSLPLFLLTSAYQILSGGDVSKVSLFTPDSYLLGTEWFLLALFISEFEYLLLNDVRSKVLRCLVVLLIFSISYASCIWKFASSTSYLTMAGISLPLLYMGSCYNRIKEYMKQSMWWLAIVSLGLFAVMIFTGVKIGIPALMVPWDPLLYIISSVAGFTFIISCCNILSQLASKSRILTHICSILSYWGYYSLFIFVLHWVVIKTLYYHLVFPRWPGDMVSIIFALFLCFLFGQIGVCLKKIKFIFQ